jgi:hypothetical protein
MPAADQVKEGSHDMAGDGEPASQVSWWRCCRRAPPSATSPRPSSASSPAELEAGLPGTRPSSTRSSRLHKRCSEGFPSRQTTLNQWRFLVVFPETMFDQRSFNPQSINQIRIVTTTVFFRFGFYKTFKLSVAISFNVLWFILDSVGIF